MQVETQEQANRYRREHEVNGKPTPILTLHRDAMTGKFLFGAVLVWHLTVTEGWWCQASHGSCVGQRHKFQEDVSFEANVTPLLAGESVNLGGKSKLHGLRFADWDSDGDMDVLVAEDRTLWFYERLRGDAFEKHKLMTYFSYDSFEVADWDGDARPDLLVCSGSSGGASVEFLHNDAFAGGAFNLTFSLKAWEAAAGGLPLPIILMTNETGCDMQAVDFDEDGDVDLAMGHHHSSWPPRRLRKYFERVSDELSALEERTGEDNPLEAFADPVQQIADLDGDGRLDVLVAVDPGDAKVCRWRYFRRAAAGTFLGSLDNPLAEMEHTFIRRAYISKWNPWDLHVADWNSDGLPDILFVDPGSQFGSYWKVISSYQHVVDRHLRRNSQFDMYEDIRLPTQSGASFIVEDWNKDGFEDVMVFSMDTYSRNESMTFRRYEFQPRGMKEMDVFSVPFNRNHTWDRDGLDNFALVDWDRDGSLDLLISSEADGKVHFYRNLIDEPAEHPFNKIQLKKDSDQAWILAKPMVVDWDKDGDLDLFLGPSDGRYFEQLADGSLHEWPLEQSPLASAMKLLPPDSSYRRRRGPKWQFVDCDADGDFDVIHVPDTIAQAAQVCEHDAGTHELRCDPDFLCLGTDVSRWGIHRWGGSLSYGGSIFFSVSAGQLKLFSDRGAFADKGRIRLWTPGFCVPSDLCNNKGHCLPGELHCRCKPGHEAADCSRCQPQYHSVRRKELQVQDCNRCPGDVAGGKVCYGRGTCFDDVMAKSLQRDSTTAWMAIGNGSCSCNEAYFSGRDQDGRSTCMEGHCPEGTEEIDGNCSSCAGGSTSDVGGFCKECGAGQFSPPGSNNCSSCPQGRVSKTSGSSTCEPCPAGTYESDRQFCHACTQGKISREGSAACSPCDAGRFAKEALMCEPCPDGTISEAGSSECHSCPAGKSSQGGSNNCSTCPAGEISQVAGSSACQTCPAGTYEINKQNCNRCPQGTISAVVGSAACSPCDAGRFAKDALTCEQCPDGTISSTGQSECQSCPSGTFSHPGSNACSECLAGTISKVPGSTECWQCAAGTFSATGSSECRNCPAGRFSEAGSRNCSECLTGTISKDGSIACEACPAGKHEVQKQFCNLCQPGTTSAAGAGFCSPCDAGRFAKDALTCEPCSGGTFAGPNSSSCQNCRLNHVSLPNSAKCRSCNDLLVRAVPDATRQTCQVSTMDIVFGLICWMTAACFSFLFLTGFFGRLPISDVTLQGDKIVITTSMAHLFLKRADPVVSFAGTGVPDLDSTSTWKVKALSSYQLTLHGEEASMPLDTSTGHMRLNFPHPFVSMGIWRCPLLGWCLFFAAVTAGVASQLMWSLTVLVCGFGFCTGLLAFALRRRQG
eukprot:s151_g25.t2